MKNLFITKYHTEKKNDACGTPCSLLPPSLSRRHFLYLGSFALTPMSRNPCVPSWDPWHPCWDLKDPVGLSASIHCHIHKWGRLKGEAVKNPTIWLQEGDPGVKTKRGWERMREVEPAEVPSAIRAQPIVPQDRKGRTGGWQSRAKMPYLESQFSSPGENPWAHL